MKFPIQSSNTKQQFFKPQLKKWLASFLMVTTLTPLIPNLAYAGDQVKVICDSDDFQLVRCPIKNEGARLLRQISESSCKRDRDWGYDRKGIWVDNGCEAEFLVTKESGSSSKDDKAAAALLGGLLLGALVVSAMDETPPNNTNNNTNNTNNNWNANNNTGVNTASSWGNNNNANVNVNTQSIVIPNWAVGSYRGRNPISQIREEIIITRDGLVRVVKQGQSFAGSWVNNAEFAVGPDRYRVSRGEGSLILTMNGSPASSYLMID
jgi:hypothetical protein